MKLWMTALFGITLLAGQNNQNQSKYLGKTWVGLLVSSTCPANTKHTLATNEADRTVSDRVTTPAVDASGTRGSADTGGNTPASRGDVPQTGDLGVAGNRNIKDSGWTEARRQASSLDATCQVGTGTREFALMLKDGALLRFDEAANAKIVDQLKTRGVSTKGKILRVQIVGKLDNGTLAVDEIQM